MKNKRRRKFLAAATMGVEKNPLCQKFREVADHLQKRNYAAALEKLDRLSSNATASGRKSQIVRLTAEIQIRQGNCLGAADLLGAQIESSKPEDGKWLELVSARVSSLLKAQQVEEAILAAKDCQKRAEANFQQTSAQKTDTLLPGQVAIVAPRSIRPSVAATRLGDLFLRSGELVAAAEFLKIAITAEPKGASCARSSLAKLCLSQGMYTEAEDYATQALELGLFQKKTLRALPLLMQARIGKKLPAISSEWIRKMDQARPRVRETMVLIVLAELRKQGDLSWKDLADKELRTPKRKNFIYQAELRKVLLAEARRQNASPDQRISAAESLLKTEKLSSLEWRSGVSQSINGRFDLGEPDQLARAAVVQAEQKFSAVAAWQTRHTLGRIALTKGRIDLGKELLQKNVAEVSPTERIWAKSMMTLAKAEYGLGDFRSSASRYLQVFDNPSGPREKFKIHALLQWSLSLLAIGDTAALLNRKADFEKAIEKVKDYVVLLNTARGLLNAPKEFNSFARKTLERGIQAAQLALEQTKTPSQINRIHFVMARRLSDFGDYQKVAESWSKLTAEEQAARWSLSENFWEWMGLVSIALWEIGKSGEAAVFVSNYLQDTATPGVGIAHLGVPLALRYMRTGREADAWTLLDQAIQAAPGHALTSYPYYWHAIRAHSAGDTSAQSKYIRLIRQALAPNTALGWQRKLLNRTTCLEVDLDEPRLKAALRPYDSENTITETIIRTQADLDLVLKS